MALFNSVVLMICCMIVGMSARAYDSNDADHEMDRRAPQNSGEQRAFDLTNQARRTGRNCGSTWYPAVPALAWNDQLGNAARRHAEDMRNKNYFSHTGSDGSNFVTRMKNAGYSCGSGAENLSGNGNVDSAINGLLNSPGHCANIMSNNKKIGVGMATGGPYGAYWVQVFGGC